ncbi:MAG: matrixin family metalloprotease [Pyrinomonadaceae bacterium]
MFYPLKIVLVCVLVTLQAFASIGDIAVTESERAERAEPAFRWRAKSISIAISASLLRQSSNIKSGSDVVGAVRRSLRTWEEAANVEFKESSSDKINVSAQGIAGDGISLITVAPTAENALLFAKNPEDTAATTRVFFDGKARITEADIVLNPYQQFSTDGTFGTFDLQATLTHEIGHLLGLAHSPMRGSTMFENFAKNGIFGLQGFSLRTLAEIDRAAIRTRYGAPDSDTDCCGSVTAKLLTPEGRVATGVDVWVEDAKGGKVVAQATTATDGGLQISGLQSGTYTLYSQHKSRTKNSLPGQEIGEVTVEAGETASLTKRLSSGPDDVDVKYIGFNGQISGSVVPVNAGKTYTIYIGGKNLSAKNTSVRFSSPNLSVMPDSITNHDFGDDFSVISFEMSSDAKTPVGEYSVFVDSASGGRSAVVGGIAVRTFLNPYSNFVLDAN